MSLSEAHLLDDLRERLFSPSESAAPRTIGIELELIPIFASTRLPALPRSGDRESTAEIISRLACIEGWAEESQGGDPPSWTHANGSRVSFEPGGQIEISSAPAGVASEVIAETQSVVSRIRDAMREADIDLISKGVDPFNGIEAVPLQLHRDRYARMTDFFESVGPSGVRMMRQTAAVQINVERGPDPLGRWALLNALAPYIVALFANSRHYAGRDTEYASYRAHLWRTLDASRTGLPYDMADPARRYLDFALDAKAINSNSTSANWKPFREWMRTGTPSEADWAFHLSTLFPEIRAKEFFEIRSADTVHPDALAAPVVFVTGLVYDDESASTATRLLGAPSEKLLERAGKTGLGDPQMRDVVSGLVELALNGARRLGAEYLSRDHVDTAQKYFDTALAG